MSDQPPPSDPDPWQSEPDPWAREPDPWTTAQPPTQPVPVSPAPSPAPRPEPRSQPSAPVVAAPVVPATTRVAPGRPKRWPESAKTAVAILVVLALAGIVGTVVGFMRASDAENQAADIPDNIAEALERAEAAEEELAVLQETSQADIDRLTAERDAAIERLGNEVPPTELAEQLAAAEAENAALTEQIEGLNERFPVQIRPDLPTANIDGQYSVTLTEVRCFNLDRCGSPPALPNATIQRTSDQLVFTVPGQFQMPMTGRSGQLFGVSLEEAAVPPCGDESRSPVTTVAIHAGATDVALDGSVVLRGLGATMMITTDAVGNCPAGEVWYGVTLTKI